MLYVTTRNKNDAHTAHKTLTLDYASDGGLFVPFQMPKISRENIQEICNKSFGQCVADILNLFFSARLDGWDVDFCIGRYPIKLVPMSQRIVIAESWHNPDWEYARMERNLYSRLCGNDGNHGIPTSWAGIAIRIATLFGLYGQLLKKGLVDNDSSFDVATATGDFTTPMSVWYARRMGLPVGKIICACNENSGLWDLLHHGQLRTDAVVTPTDTPLCDYNAPNNLERLLYSSTSPDAVHDYLKAKNTGVPYVPGEDVFDRIRQGLFAAVIGRKRIESIISSVYRISTYLLDPYGALAYGALQDYRSTHLEGKTTIILTEKSPICNAEIVSKSLGITVEDLRERLSMA